MNKTSRQPSEREEIFADEATNKALISKIYKQLVQLNIKKETDNPSKLGRRSTQTLLQRRCTNGQRVHENINSTNYWRNANQNYNEVLSHTGQYNHHQKPTNNTCWGEYEEKGTILHYQWEFKLVQPLWRTVCWFYKKKLKIELLCDLATPLLGIYVKKTRIQKDTCTPVFSAALYNCQDTEPT